MTPFDTRLVPSGDIFIGGEWRRGRAATFASIYPADQSVNMEISTASAEDAKEAVEAADAAWRKPDWSGLKPHQRALVLYRIADLITQRHEALAQLQRRDNGKPIAETRVLVASAANTFRYFAACLETLDDELTPPRGDYMTMSVHEPIGVIAAIGSNVRFYRTLVLEEMGQDYVRTARAKGVSERAVLFRHVLKNAAIPILTSAVLRLPFLLTGSLLLESFFAIPGLGTLTVDAINSQDFAVVRAMVFLGTLLYITGALLTDISYALMDPRVRLE